MLQIEIVDLLSILRSILETDSTQLEQLFESYRLRNVFWVDPLLAAPFGALRVLRKDSARPRVWSRCFDARMFRRAPPGDPA